MKKDIIVWLAVSVAVMMALPWLAVTFVQSDAGMACSLLLLFAVNPIYALMTGVFAGKDVRRLWSLPVILAVFFLAGTWMFFDRGETAFISYAAVYLGLGIAVMLVCLIFR